MDFQAQKEKLLSQLREYSGIGFEITDSDLGEEETIGKLKDLLGYYNMTESKSKFYLNYMLGKLSMEDITRGILRFRIEEDKARIMYYLETKNDVPYSKEVISVLKNFIPNASAQVLEITEKSLVILREADEIPEKDMLLEEASNIVDVLETEAYTTFNISFDKPCEKFIYLPKQYQDVSVAMRIGKKFYSDRSVFDFNELGLGRLLYNLPEEEKEAFVENNINKEEFMKLDVETMGMLRCFFDNDLSIAETARQLFMHRNTLIYKLDKFQNNTGLDVRRFKDAQICQIGLMLVNKD